MIPYGRRRGERPAFLLQGPVMLGMMLLGFVVYVGIMTTFTGMVQANVVESLTRVPTIHLYDANTGERVTVVPDATRAEAAPLLALRDELRAHASPQIARSITYEERLEREAQIDEINRQLIDMGYHDVESSNYTLYMWFAVPATVLLLFVLFASCVGHFWERGFGLWRRGYSASALRAAVFGLVLIWLTPEVWDAYAISMTDFALYLLHPDGDPQTVVDDLWCRMGATASCMFDFAGVLDPVSWSTALASPGDMGQSLLGEILLPFFMLTPALAVSLATFIISEVRILFVTLVLVTLPLWVLLLHVPFVRPHARQMIDSMIGASMAPFLSAITLHAGWAYLANNPLPSLEDWISALGTIALAGSWPVALAPALGRISGKVDGAVSSAIVSSSMMAMQMGMGLAAGGLQGAQQAAGAGLRGEPLQGLPCLEPGRAGVLPPSAGCLRWAPSGTRPSRWPAPGES